MMSMFKKSGSEKPPEKKRCCLLRIPPHVHCAEKGCGGIVIGGDKKGPCALHVKEQGSGEQSRNK